MTKTVAPAASLQGSLLLPADKSISHRAALFAALGEGQSIIKNYSQAVDPQTTLQCLQQLGVPIQQNDDSVTIEGVGREGLQTPNSAIDCQNSGTTLRLLSGIVGGAGIKCTLIGDESLSHRTMKRIIEPLQKMGIEITARDDDFAPLHIHRKRPLKPIKFQLPIGSAQLKSCVLLAGLFNDEPTMVIETVPSRDHTERLLQLPVERKKYQKIISSSLACNIPLQSYRIPGDFSAAAFWLAGACIHPDASMQLQSVGVNPTRTGALQALQQMGAEIIIENEHIRGFEPVADIRVKSTTLRPMNITPQLVPNCIDELPILIIAMLFADGVSHISGAAELRHKETDRLAAMFEILETAGAAFDEAEDGLTIHGDPNFIPNSGSFKSHGDHRIAMAAAVLALLAKSSSKIINAACTRISYPSFWKDLSKIQDA